ncbi:hypothetical protein AX769_21335 (plasmid) [Frondihabitans sp. PAMC 28766]|uniref:hypothetical protein n=1 Tax=Frondihabitans sp. PAMC 28766 TaxID=1795630 RepID=UPI00078B912A|nr:hypothetical protein [Frondihabitans sp. PAMC 28766]AMM22677.1 hypothetical protein AX769_21335 [Frondihabitans sp. PAMC 28766]
MGDPMFQTVPQFVGRHWVEDQMDYSTSHERAAGTKAKADRYTVVMVLVALGISFFVAPFVPIGFLVLLPILLLLTHHLFVRHAWKRELNTLLSDVEKIT